MKQRTYTPKNRALIHAALVDAKSRLSIGVNDLGTTYICWAICHPYEMSTPGQRMAQNMIMSRIKGYGTVSAWLAHNTLGSFREWMREVRSEQYVDAIQAYRHRWLDSLIEEFSK